MRKKLLIRGRPHRKLGNVPHFVKSKSQLSSGSEESSCCRAEQLQDGIEAGDADIDPEACPPDRFIQSELP
jgi:hypothetical protein